MTADRSSEQVHFAATSAMAQWSPVLLLLSALAAFFSPVLFAERSFNSDGQLGAYLEPFRLWSNAWASGWPVAADVLAMHLYPLRLLMAAAGAPFDAFVFSAYVAFGLGVYLLLARRTGRGPALLGAVSATLGGFMLGHVGHTSMVHAAAWLPWMLVAVDRLTDAESFDLRRVAWLAALAAATALCLTAGHLQILAYSALFAGAYAAFLAAATRQWGVISWTVVGLGLGAGLGAASLLPSLELAGMTFRDKLEGDAVFAYALFPAELPDVVLPLLSGATPLGMFGKPYSGPFFGETLVFVPAMCLALVCLALIDGKLRGYALFWLGVLLIALGLSLGKAVPGLEWVTRTVYPLNRFQAPGRHMLEFSIAVGALVAIGARAALDGGARLRVLLAAVGAMGLIVAAAVGLYLLLPADPAGWRARLHGAGIPLPVALAFVALAAVALLSMVSTRLQRTTKITVIFAALIAQTALIGYQLPWDPAGWRARLHGAGIALPAALAFVALAAVALLLMVSTRLPRTAKVAVMLAVVLAQSALIGYQLPWYVYAGRDGWHERVEWSETYRRLLGADYRALAMDGWVAQTFNPDLSRVNGLTIAGWYGPLLLRPYSELSGVTIGGWTRRDRLEDRSSVLDVLSVRYVSINAGEAGLLESTPARWRYVESVGNERVFENLRALPRARVACAAGPPLPPGQDPLMAIHYGSVRGGDFIDTAGGIVPARHCSAPASIVAEHWRGLTVRAVGDTATLSYLVLSDNWYPGWEVSVNGRPRPLLKANHTLRAVALDAGDNVVEMTFRPASLAVGVLLLAVTVGLLAGMVAWVLHRQARSEPAESMESMS